MSVESIDPINVGMAIFNTNATQQNHTADFSSWLDTQVQEVNQQILSSEDKLQSLATGEYNNLHDVMMSLEKAKLSFELVVQVRNKLLEGYQEIMRMQI